MLGIRPSRVVPVGGCLLMAAALCAFAGPVEQIGLALVDDALLDDLGEVAVVHDYGAMSLVRLKAQVPGRLGARVHLLPAATDVGFRAWSAPVRVLPEPSDFGGGVLVFDLVGPMDPRWRIQLDAGGVEVLAAADPHALIVRTDGAGLALALTIETSEGFPIIRGFGPLPLEARVHRSLAPVVRGGKAAADLELRLFGYDGHPLSIGGTRTAVDDHGGVRVGPGGLARLLMDHPEIGYVEPVFGREVHNNLVARADIVAVEPVWDLGYNGSGVIISHNDSGVDLGHPDLTGAVIATNGRMAYFDTAHGTHTAGSIVVRGLAPSPINSSDCGDLTETLPTVRGMAWGAELVANNIFDEGYGQVSEMMAWGARHGAHLSSNSWGLVDLGEPVAGYTAAAVEADRAVRDADPDTPGSQPLTIFFSAGNIGPSPGSVTAPATAKNVITIGAVENNRCGAWVPSHQDGPDPEMVLTGSGRGPSQGRVKPDLVAPGSDVLSTESGDDYAVELWDQDWTGPAYALNTGTSQACAVAAGAGAVLHEFLWRNRGVRPSPALVKAALIVSAAGGGAGADFDRGWGRVDLASGVGGLENGTATFLDAGETMELVTGSSWGAPVMVRSSAAPLEFALVWTDVAGEEDADHPLVNDLDLLLTSPDGTVYRGNISDGAWSDPDPGTDRDRENNVEVIRVEFPEPGAWTVEVVGVNVAATPVGFNGQDFALAMAGDAGPCIEAPPAPATLAAFPGSANQIRLSWSSVSGATRYEISRSESPGGHPYVPIADLGAGVVSFVDTDVSGGSEYYYVVRAYRSCWSDYSLEASATANGSCLLTPIFAGIASSDAPSGANCLLELKWVPAAPRCPNPVLYSVFREDEPVFEPGLDNLVAENVIGSRWLDDGLEGGRDYFYVVRAHHYGQDFDDGNNAVLGGRPVGPVNLYLSEDVEGAVNGWTRERGSEADTGSESWLVTDDDAWAGDHAWFVADEDRVKDQVLQTAEPIPLPEGSAPVLEFFHRYRLLRGRDGGRLEYSTNGGRDWFDILEGDGQTVPDAPQRWLNGGYTDTIGAPSNPLFLAQGWTGDSTGWVHSEVDLGDFAGRWLLLRWRMGCDETPGAGWGWWLDEIRISVQHECDPCPTFYPPWGLDAEATGDGVLLDWHGPLPYDQIRVSRATGSEGPFEVLATIDASESNYRDTSASGGTTYTYVYAVAADGCWSNVSAGVSVTAGGPCKLAPLFWGLDEIRDPRDTGCALDLEWRPASPGCDGAPVRYRVHRSEDPSFDPRPETLIADGVAGPRFRDLTVADGVQYNYRVRAVDGVSGAEETNPVVRTGSTTGPDEVHFSDSIDGDLSAWRTGVGSSQDSGTESWEVVDDLAHSAGRAWFCRNEPQIKDQVVALTDAFEILDDTTVLSFYHHFDLEPFWDGGRLEYSTDGGMTWHDMLLGDGSTVGDDPDRFLVGGYTGFVSAGTGHPFGGARAWTGFDDGWTETVVNLADLVGLAVEFRWRLGCDRTDARAGWWVDDVELRTTSRCETVVLPQPRQGQGRLP